MNLKRFSECSLETMRHDRHARREFERSMQVNRAYFERKTRGKLATAYCVDQADAQALIDYAEAHDLYLSKVLRESDKLTKSFAARFTSRSLCEFLADKNADHTILTSADVFADINDFLAFLRLCRKARVKIHLLNPQLSRFTWKLAFWLFT